MSLYYDAAPFLSEGEHSGSLRSRIFTPKNTAKSQPKHIYALASEALKWSFILAEVIDKSQLLQLERKLSPQIALLLVHDLLLAKRGISAPTSHALRLAVERHKARLNAEFVKARLRRGFSTIDALRAQIEAGKLATEPVNNGEIREPNSHAQRPQQWAHPRWVRINILKSTLDEQIRTTFSDFNKIDSLQELLLQTSVSRSAKLLYVDEHVPHLLALPPDTDLSKSPAYLGGLIILQDKASCFPAYLLNARPEDGKCLDACAAPGNKASHLAAIISEHNPNAAKPTVYACERDGKRALTLRQMVRAAGAEYHVSTKAKQDFLRTDPSKAPWKDVGCLLLDPSCSGSGIAERDETINIVLPRKQSSVVLNANSKKRKRTLIAKPEPAHLEVARTEETPPNDCQPLDQLRARLASLSAFQLKLLLHAFQFPKARKITYSTCSIYAEENEHVVIKALGSLLARKQGWRLLIRDEQVPGMKTWPIRGSNEACGEMVSIIDRTMEEYEIADACIRCEKGTIEGTQGFFVAAFVRELAAGAEEEEESEWGGFDERGI